MSKVPSVTFLNTRPRLHSQPLTKSLIQMGLNVVELPLINIQPLALDDTAKQHLQQLHQYQMIICISPTAVQLASQFIINANVSKQALTWVAVGQATQAYLFNLGVDKVCLPTTKNNEGMLQMPEIISLNDSDRVLFLRGQEGRQLLINELRQKGVSITNVELYKRLRPTQLEDEFIQVKNNVGYVLISSGESWQHWLSLFGDLACVNNYKYIVLGNRIAEKIRKMNAEYAVIHDLSPKTIYNAVQYFSQ